MTERAPAIDAPNTFTVYRPRVVSAEVLAVPSVRARAETEPEPPATVGDGSHRVSPLVACGERGPPAATVGDSPSVAPPPPREPLGVVDRAQTGLAEGDRERPDDAPVGRLPGGWAGSSRRGGRAPCVRARGRGPPHRWSCRRRPCRRRARPRARRRSRIGSRREERGRDGGWFRLVGPARLRVGRAQVAPELVEGLEVGGQFVVDAALGPVVGPALVEGGGDRPPAGL